MTGVTKRFGEVIAVRDVTLDVLGGEFVALLGPSGSGKTTTLMMVAGLEDPDEGQIFIGVSDVTATPPHKRNLGMVFQSYALFPHMTVEENVAFPLKMRGTPRPEVRRRVGETLELVRLSGMEARLPRQLSGGQQQRVALARVVVFRPSVLLMDEPLGALDRKLREEMQDEIRQLQQRIGIATLYVTHDQEEALALADRVAVMNQGRIEQVGTPRELYDAPASPFVADFVGESNFLEGKVVEGPDAQTVLVECADVRVAARGPRPPGVATRAQVVIRPERIRLVGRSGAPEADVNACAGTVSRVTFVGSVWRLDVKLASGKRVRVRIPHEGAPAFPAPVGSRVWLAWNVDDPVVVSSPPAGE